MTTPTELLGQVREKLESVLEYVKESQKEQQGKFGLTYSSEGLLRRLREVVELVERET